MPEQANEPRADQMETFPVPPHSQPDEPGAITYARDIAHATCGVLNGSEWRAEFSSPRLPGPDFDVRRVVRVLVDEQHEVSVVHTTPAGTNGDRDLWMVRLDGKQVPHRPFPLEWPHQPEGIARSLVRHLHGVPVEPCDTPGCEQPPVVATRTQGLCQRCAVRYARAGQ